MSAEPSASTPSNFLPTGSDVAELIARFDWSTTPIGPIETWPQSLKTITGFLLRSPTPIVLLWGVQGVMIYNDAYSVFAGARHPDLLGMNVREAWPEVADFNDNVMKVGLAGGALTYTDQELSLNRSGRMESAWLDLGYSPVIDESGKPGGVIAIVVETTERVLARRRQADAVIRQRRQFEQAPGFIIVMGGPEHTVEFVNDTHRRVFGSDDWVGETIRDAFPSIADQGFYELLDQVYETGETIQFDATPVRYRRTATGPEEVRYMSFIYAPISDETGAISGVFCDGFDVTDRVLLERRREALNTLSEGMRQVETVADLGHVAAKLLGDALGASRVGYGTIDPIAETLHVERDWTAEGVVTLAGVTALREYGSFIDSLKRDEFICITDVRDDPRTAPAAAALEGRSARSFVNVPVVEQGVLVAVLFVNHAEARVWTNEELDLIREVAERTRTAVERTRGEATLRLSEARLRFLDALARETAKLADADAILRATTRMVGEHLGISNCAYADMDEDQDGFTIRGDWAAPGSPSIIGHYSLADFGELAVSRLGAGLPLIVNDNLAELAPHEAATFQSIGIAATICVPLVKDGRLTALMAIHDKTPHAWTSAELALIREVTERSWAHVERVGAEAELRASEENFRTLARAMPNQVWTAQPDGQLDWFNEAVHAYSGTLDGALTGDNWTRIVHADDLPATAERWAAALAGGDDYQTEFRLRRNDGAWRWHLVRAVAVKGAFGQVIRWVGSNTDIHDQKEAAATLEQRVEERTAQLLQAEEALRQSQKMEAVGQLTGGIAHDFNNLLAGIGGGLEMLEKRLAEGRADGVQRYIDMAQASTRRAAALTQRLLAFSRRQTLAPKPTDANRLVAEMEDLVRRTVGPAIVVESVIAPDLWLTEVDPSQLENALLNLAINARDAMPDGGRIRIVTSNKELLGADARERDLTAGQYICLCVADTGSGMTREVADRAFDPFFTTKPLGQGTGLGLSMIHGFVRQSGGSVLIETALGEGASIHIFLPRYFGNLDSADASEALAGEEAGLGETVLVIDDEAAVRTLVVEVLQDAGYRVLEAEDGQAGLAILDTDRRIDLLITDVGLPGGVNGRQVADVARLRRPELKVLFITGYAEHAVLGAGRLEPGMQVVTKPFSMAGLGARVREILAT